MDSSGASLLFKFPLNSGAIFTLTFNLLTAVLRIYTQYLHPKKFRIITLSKVVFIA